MTDIGSSYTPGRDKTTRAPSVPPKIKHRLITVPEKVYGFKLATGKQVSIGGTTGIAKRLGTTGKQEMSSREMDENMIGKKCDYKKAVQA